MAAYEDMVRNKTGGLFRLAVKLTAACCFTATATATDLTPPLIAACDALAVYFQTRDDLINLASPSYHASKGFADDISEGKLSFPVLDLLCEKGPSAPESRELVSLLRARPKDEPRRRRAVALLRECGSLQRTLEFVRRARANVDAHLDALRQTPQLARVRSALDQLDAAAADVQP